MNMINSYSSGGHIETTLIQDMIRVFIPHLAPALYFLVPLPRERVILLRPLIGSVSDPRGDTAPITEHSLSSPLHECQRLQGKITAEALEESS